MNELTAKIEQDIKKHLQANFSAEKIYDKQYQQIFEYAVLPAGKLFRAQLVWSVFGDIQKINMQNSQTLNSKNHQFLSSAIEIHHAYTLVHDDMPCMDNDDYRRGKLSTHKKYGEWKALLIGDGLLNLSYQILSEIEHERTQQVFKLFSSNCGHTGLIYGQYEHIKRIHQLKTGRLFETSMMASYLLTDSNDENIRSQLEKISASLGVLFQLLDDLTELPEIKNQEHEKEINPWISHYDETAKETIHLLNTVRKNTKGYPQTESVIQSYFEKIKLFLLANKPALLTFVNKSELLPLISGLE
jgi:geranylgeranyl pyrophosphate synthase